MAGQFGVTPEELRAQASNVSGVSGELETAIAAMNRTQTEVQQHIDNVRNIVQSALEIWSGDAAGAFTATSNEWNTQVTGVHTGIDEALGNLQKLQNTLSEISTGMRVSADNYQASDDAARRTFTLSS